VFLGYANTSITKMNMGNFEVERVYRLGWQDQITAFCVTNDCRQVFAACSRGLVCWDAANDIPEYVLKFPPEVTSVTRMDAVRGNSIAFQSACGIFYLLNLKKRLITLHVRER
jgi:hypothetical protein